MVFTINGKLYKGKPNMVSGTSDSNTFKIFTVNPHSVSVDTSLGTFIRKNAQLSGTKMVCREGGCGSCIVNLNGEHPVSRERQSWAVNSVIGNLNHE